MSAPTTPRGIRLAEIRARVDAATPGEWYANDYYQCVGTTRVPLVAVCRDGDAPENKANREFIAEAREDVPFLLDELELALNGLDERRERFGRAVDLFIDERARSARADAEITRLQRIVEGATSFTFGWFEVTQYEDDTWEVEHIGTGHGTTSKYTKDEAIRVALECDAKEPRPDDESAPAVQEAP